ncbi:MAG: hydrogenase nickel incorporation protein HypB [Legionellales bacterium]|nr:hydrogenase nickel incorporation protein HypB [Legionellales bacterium]
MCGYCGCQTMTNERYSHPHTHEHVESKLVTIEQDILAENQRHAEHNRRYFLQRQITTLNFVSSPGAGKTTLLVASIPEMLKHAPVMVFEGDQHTTRDAERIGQTGVPVLQINTGKQCHLDAHRIGHALDELPPKEKSFLLIENVGNLVCPALFDLGEACKIVVLSVTEGNDKPLKYPYMFAAAKMMVITKTDLLPYVDFDLEQCIAYARQINPAIEVCSLSVTNGDGMETWIQWIAQR